MKWLVVALYVFAIAFIHLRGHVRLPLRRQLFDHSSLVAPLNMLMVLLSRVPSVPYFPNQTFSDLAPLQAHWRQIREEALQLIEAGKIKAATKNDDAGFNSFFKNGWKRFYLKWYDASHRRRWPAARARWRCCASCLTSRRRCSPNCRPAPR